jgi:NAD-dependent deacetylase
MKKVVVLSGAGISAESGISTFRDSGGLWEQYRIEEVATYEAWESNSDLVLDFYNKRRKQLGSVEPNAGHFALVKMEDIFDVHIITQNVDNLHERAGSSKILHLHGELTKVRSTHDDDLIYDIGFGELKKGDTCEKGYQLRPHIVWFGEAVPAIPQAARICETADIFIVVGTSMNVYPAAGLINYVGSDVPKFMIDPGSTKVYGVRNLVHIQKKAGEGLPELLELLKKEYV